MEEKGNSIWSNEEINELIGNLPDIVRFKSEGNAFYNKQDYDTALHTYFKAVDLIVKCEDTIKQNLVDQVDINENLNQFKQNLKKESVPLFSNIALCYFKLDQTQLSIEYDIKVISLDPLYDKSYVRLIQNYVKSKKMDNAAYYFLKLKNSFNEETLKKYAEILPELEKNLQQNSEIMKSMTKTAKTGFGLYRYILMGGLIVLGLAWFCYNNYYKQ